MQNDNKQSATTGDEGQKTTGNTPPPKTVNIRPHGKDKYEANPEKQNQEREGGVTFYNRTSDDVELSFTKGGAADTPFGGSQPYPVPGQGNLPLTVRSDAGKGTYKYTIVKAASGSDEPDESPEQSKEKKPELEGGTNPEMIID